MPQEASVKKIMMINPPGKVYLYPDGSPAHRKHCTPPLGLAYLAAHLLQSDYEVVVLDALAEGYSNETIVQPYLYYGLSNEQIVERIAAAKPDIIGVSVLFSNIFREALELCRALKQAFPDTPIVMGGHHPTGAPVEVMRHPEVDYVLIAEADLSLPLLLDALNGKVPLEAVPGLYYRRDGDVVNTMENARRLAEGEGWAHYNRKDLGTPDNLRETPLPAWHVINMDAYWQTDVRIGGGDAVRERYAVMVSTRGCPHVCFFCTSPLMAGYKGYRRRTNEEVLAEIRWLRDRYGVQEVQFLDDNFYVSKPRVKALLKTIAEEFPDMVFGVPGGTEVNALDEEVIDLMAAANFHKTLLAIEAGDPELQKALVDKHVNLSRVPYIVDYLKAHKIETRALFMIGFPDETRQSIEKTIQLARSLDVDDFYISIVTPLPGTPLYDQCKEKDLFVDGYDVNNIRFSTAVIKLPDTTPEELEELRRVVWREAFEEKRRKMEVLAGDDRKKKFTNREDYELAGFRSLSRHLEGAA